MRVEEEKRCGQHMEHFDRDTTQKPTMSPTQTMCGHCDQGNIMLFLSIRDDLCCRVSLQNLRLYVYPSLISEVPGYMRQVVVRPFHLFVKPVLGELYAHKAQRGNRRDDTQQCNPGGGCTRKSCSMGKNRLCVRRAIQWNSDVCLHTILPCASVLSPLSKALAQGMTARLLQPGLLVFPPSIRCT